MDWTAYHEQMEMGCLPYTFGKFPLIRLQCIYTVSDGG